MPDVTGKLGHEAEVADEAEFLRRYPSEKYPKASNTVDVVIFTVIDNDLKVLLIERAGHPFQGMLAIPGGFLDVGDAFKDQGEDLETAAARELEEETGLPPGSCFIEQLYTFGKPYRDPRTRVITVAYYALMRPDLAGKIKAGSDARSVSWYSVASLWNHQGLPLGVAEVREKAGENLYRPMAFDHNVILKMAVDRIRGKVDYSPIAFALVPEEFSRAQFQNVYEAIKGRAYNVSTFDKRFRRMVEDEVIIPVGTAPKPGRSPGGRPPMLYRFRKPTG